MRTLVSSEQIHEMILQSMGGFTEEQLRAAMDKVQDPANWKYPINAVIDRSDLDVTVKAVEFFTGSKLEIAEDLGDKLRVTAIGYYAAVGA